jgi:hypothetical protein
VTPIGRSSSTDFGLREEAGEGRPWDGNRDGSFFERFDPGIDVGHGVDLHAITCTRDDVLGAGVFHLSGAAPALRPHRRPLKLRIKFAADQSDDGENVHPHQQRDAGAHGAVHYVVVPDIAHIPGEARGRA